MTDHHAEIPIVKHTISFRSPRAVALLNPTLPIAVALLILSVTFTIWPAALEHSPVGFERRGVIHHIWHYMLLAGALLALVGMFATFRRRLQFELAGMFLMTGAVTMNLTAVISEAGSPVIEEPSGLGMALRAAVIAVFVIRAGVLLFEPTVQIPGLQLNESR